MLHGTETCVILILYHENIGEVSLLMTIENVVNVNQMYVALFVCDIKHPNILNYNFHLVFPSLLETLSFSNQERKDNQCKIAPNGNKQNL